MLHALTFKSASGGCTVSFRSPNCATISARLAAGCPGGQQRAAIAFSKGRPPKQRADLSTQQCICRKAGQAWEARVRSPARTAWMEQHIGAACPSRHTHCAGSLTARCCSCLTVGVVSEAATCRRCSSSPRWAPSAAQRAASAASLQHSSGSASRSSPQPGSSSSSRVSAGRGALWAFIVAHSARDGFGPSLPRNAWRRWRCFRGGGRGGASGRPPASRFCLFSQPFRPPGVFRMYPLPPLCAPQPAACAT